METHLPVLRQSVSFAGSVARHGKGRIVSEHRDTEVLIRQIDRRLATLGASPGGDDLDLAERLAATLRALVVVTGSASAADRARVRAAVRFFVVRRDGRLGRLRRSLLEDLRVVNRTATELGRDDLVVAYDGPARLLLERNGRAGG
jgi:hypothetical protein